jgi:LysR family transcriptional regulator, low CO2-responsive transcriptional regulator
MLTEAGALVLSHGRRILEQIVELDQAIGELKGLEGGSLRICVATTVNYFAARAVAAFCRAHPAVQVSLDVTNRATLLGRLTAGETDIALMGQPPRNLDLVADPFKENPLVVIAEPGHRLARRRGVPLAALADEVFLVREQGSGTRIAMERFFDEHGFERFRDVEMTSNEAIKQGVEAGLGLGIVSLHTLELELQLARLAVLDVEGFPIHRRWYVVHRTSQRLSPAARAFREQLLTEVDVEATARNEPRTRRSGTRRTQVRSRQGKRSAAARGKRHGDESA